MLALLGIILLRQGDCTAAQEAFAASVDAWRSAGVRFIPIAWADRQDGTAPTPFGRFIAFEDPFGHEWNVATHVEEVPPDEVAKRAAQAAEAG